MKRGLLSVPRAALAAAVALLSFLPATAPALSATAPTKGQLDLLHKTITTAKGVKIEADSGTLWVPENRAVATSRPIAIQFLRMRSTAASPRAPLFFLEGGPGSRGMTERPEALDYWAPYLSLCDVVLINQRGTNDSLLTWNWDGPPPMDYFVSADSAAAHIALMRRRAAPVFKQRGIDLAGYTTIESAADLDALRKALGSEKVSLLGFSYGTHLATAYVRYYGDRVENAVLIGTEGPGETMKLPWTMDVQMQKLALIAAQDPKIAAKAPDLMALYDRVIAKLEKQPMVVEVTRPGGDALKVPIGPFGLRYVMRIDVGDASDLVVFPRLLWSIDQGDPSVLAWFVRKRAGGALGVHGMATTMDMASGASPARRALIGEQAKTSRFADVIDGVPESEPPAWPIPDVGDAFRAPLVSSARMLFISAELDMNTPPYQAEALRWGLPNSTHLIVANAGHEQTFYANETSPPVIKDFLAGQDVRDRKITYPPLRFVPLEGKDDGHPSVR